MRTQTAILAAFMGLTLIPHHGSAQTPLPSPKPQITAPLKTQLRQAEKTAITKTTKAQIRPAAKPVIPAAPSPVKSLHNEFTIARQGDLELSCLELIAEADSMHDIVNISDDQITDSQFQKKGIGVAGAIGSFLVGSLTGGIGFAAAGFLAKEIPENRAEEAAQFRDIATQRRSLMMGIYQAKGCENPWPEELSGNTDISEADAQTEQNNKNDNSIPQYNAADQSRYNQ